MDKVIILAGTGVSPEVLKILVDATILETTIVLGGILGFVLLLCIGGGFILWKHDNHT